MTYLIDFSTMIHLSIMYRITGVDSQVISISLADLIDENSFMESLTDL